MAKELHNDVYDAALAEIATCTNLNFCTSQPANYAAISGVSIASKVLTAGDGNGDYTITDGDVSGRKLTVAAQTALTLTANGTVAWAVLDDGVTLLAATSASGTITDYTTETWDSPAFDIEIADPT